MNTGKLFVIEGLDGSGKQTQSELITKRLNEEGINALRASYPNYDSPSSALVKMYLNGDFGKDANNIDPKIASTFYAIDRYATYKTKYEEFYNNGGIIICDRYSTSNMLHQGCKITDTNKKEEYLNWLDSLEYDLYKIPRPNKVFFLDINPAVSKKLIENRKNKFTKEEKKDIHESNFKYLLSSYKNASYLKEKYKWININCIKDDKLKSINEINDDLYNYIKKEINKEK